MVNRKKKKNQREPQWGPTILSTGFTVTLNFQFFFLHFFPPYFYRYAQSVYLPVYSLCSIRHETSFFLLPRIIIIVFHSRSVKSGRAGAWTKFEHLSNKTRNKKASTDWWKEEKKNNFFLSSWPNCLTRRKPEPETKFFSLRKMDGLMLMTLWRENGSRNEHNAGWILLADNMEWNLIIKKK